MKSDERGASPTGGERLVLWTRMLGASEPTRANVDRAASRFRAAGGEILAALGGTVVVAFEEFDAVDAAQIAADVLDAADAIDVSIGAAFGTLEASAPGIARGAVLDRAQWLAHHASPGGVLVDDEARSILSEHFLFSPALGEEAGARRGHPVDRSAPTLPMCRAAVSELARPSLPRALAPAARDLESFARSSGISVVLARGSQSAGLDLVVDHVRETVSPPLVLRVGPVPFGLEPLGSIRHALCGLLSGADARASALARVEAEHRETLEAVTAGAPIDLAEAAKALASLFASAAGAKGWIVVDPFTSIDASSARLLRSLADGGTELLLVYRVPLELDVPVGALGRVAPESLALSPLGDDAADFAASLLGVSPESDEARFVAALGGSAPLGVLEAARTLVSRGDLLRRGEGFAFRQRLRPRKASVPLARLLQERLRGLETSALRMLEVVSLCPVGTPRVVLEYALELDGLDERARDEATDTLARERWIEGDRAPHPSSEPVRAAVLKLMAPARRLELHSFLARATAERAQGAFARVAAASHARAAGEAEPPAEILLEAAEAAKSARHLRAALKLAATAVEWSRSPEIRRRAAALARTEESEGGPDEHEGDGETALSSRWIDALRSRDFELADRVIDESVAEGAPLLTAETLRAWMAIARGEPGVARDLTRSTPAEDSATEPRVELVSAWVDLSEGRAREAIARALAVLSGARGEGDKARESAALATLAGCFLALGREADARSLAQLAGESARSARALRSKSA